MVAIQLKIFTPVGTAMSMLAGGEGDVGARAPGPTANMWCAQTPKLRMAMATVDPATNS